MLWSIAGTPLKRIIAIPVWEASSAEVKLQISFTARWYATGEPRYPLSVIVMAGFTMISGRNYGRYTAHH